MELTKLFLRLLSLFFILSFFAGKGFGGYHHHLRQHFEASKLFVFGDSYVDTGNEGSLNYPYGITFPGKPDGRYSDGRLLTDFMASFLGLESPTPYMQLYEAGPEGLKNGVNFGFGGTGVFDTDLYQFPNLTEQIDLFDGLIANSTLIPQDITSSLALVSVSGNDYLTYLVHNITNLPGLFPFISSLINNLSVDLKRINSFGVKKVVITALGPVECVPLLTFIKSFEQCISRFSPVVDYHNLLLKQAVTKLNNEASDSPFFILDLHSAFSYILKNKGYPKGNITFATPLKPCCTGQCGQRDKEGKKLYGLCEDPNSAFYWDFVHPTQRGWFAALSYLIDATDPKQSY